MVRLLLSLIFICLNIFSQQPNTPNATLIDNVFGGSISVPCLNSVGGFPICFNTLSVNPVCIETRGISGTYFEVWGVNGSLVPGSIFTAAGIVDLDIFNFSLGRMWNGNIGLNGNFIVCVSSNILLPPYGFSLQGIMVDPTSAAGARLTAGINIFHP